MAQIEFKKDEVYGDWKLIKRISGGGNGSIWTTLDANGNEKIIKLLKKTHKTARKRFIDEIKITLTNKSNDGVIDIIDTCDISEKTKTLWYVMEKGILIQEKLKNQDASDIVLSIFSISKTLTELHSGGISHRDIKPQNLLFVNEKFVLADFGLVDYPLKEEGLTLQKNPLGPRWTIAPEMRNEPEKSDGLKADVYSLSKTLWILLSKVDTGFEGQYNPKGSIGLKSYQSSMYLSIIEPLLIKSTENDPKLRPNMIEFSNELAHWLDLNKDFVKKNQLDWKLIQQKLFPLKIPKNVVWEDVESIVTILNILGSIKNLNHMFFPDGGGFDLKGARQSTLKGCIELDFGLLYIVKPKRLIFEGFNDEFEWNYFRLELENLQSISGNPRGNSEEVIEINGNEYKPINFGEDYYNKTGKTIPNSRILSIILGGSFVIFQKRSTYNLTNEVYDGRHNKVNSKVFRNYITDIINSGYKILDIRDKDEKYYKTIIKNGPMLKIENYI